jgi:hypothetical protein
VGRGGRGEQKALKQVLEGGMEAGWMLAFGDGRWSWALVWATVSGRTGQRGRRLGEIQSRRGEESELAEGGQEC